MDISCFVVLPLLRNDQDENVVAQSGVCAQDPSIAIHVDVRDICFDPICFIGGVPQGHRMWRNNVGADKFDLFLGLRNKGIIIRMSAYPIPSHLIASSRPQGPVPQSNANRHSGKCP